MPELPDITVYIEAFERMLVGQPLRQVQLRSPFLLRSFEIEPATVVGQQLQGVRRRGKRIIWDFTDNYLFVFHLMIAGRFHWKPAGTRPTRKVDLAAFDFPAGTLMLTEAGSKKRASLHVLRGASALAQFPARGLSVLEADVDEFAAALHSENRTLKRFLTDPRLLDGIGNAYSDEILHAARLSPFRRTSQLDSNQVRRLFDAIRAVLLQWTQTLREEVGDGFPEKVTAFRGGMAVHGRYGEPCPVCQAPVQRIRYADKEMNYCAGCQTDGRILADRSLSKLLKDDWPRTLEELENG